MGSGKAKFRLQDRGKDRNKIERHFIVDYDSDFEKLDAVIERKFTCKSNH